MDVSGGLESIGLVNDFAIGGADGNDRYYPAVDVNAAGDKTMVYNISGPATFISTDSISIPHTLSCTQGPCFGPAETTLASGSAAYQQFSCTPGQPCPPPGAKNRWGDYSSAAADPDGTGIWVHGEFAGPSSSVTLGSATWETVVGLTNEAPDTTPPLTTATVDPTPVSGWDRSPNVFVTLNATDDRQNGVRSITYSVSGAQAIPSTTVTSSFAALSLQNEGVSTVLFQATDDWGNVESQESQTVSIDRTAPGVLCTPPDSAWHATDQSSTCAAADALSGLANSTDAAFTLTTPVPVGTETASAFTDTRSVCDVAGNCTQAGPVGPFMVDKKPPTISISSPTAATYTLNQVVPVGYGCTDGGSGVATCAGPVPSGGNLDTSTVGLHSFTVNSTDNVGNQSKLTVTYTVSYSVCLLYDPTKVHAPGAYSFRIELCDFGGQNVSSSSVTVQAKLITPDGIFPQSNSSPSNLFFFDPMTSSYTYVLDTMSLMPASTKTYQLQVLASGDPTVHNLPFIIK
jgi:hypothetical protein